MMKLLFVLFLSLSLVNCSWTAWRRPTRNGTTDTPSTHYVCINLPESHRSEAARAVELWDQAMSQWVHLKVAEGPEDWCRYTILETTMEYPDDPEALAWASMIGGREVSLIKGRYEHDITGIVLHELGHCLGAQHVPGTLMNPRWEPGLFVCPDATTVAQVAAWHHADLGLLSWCAP